MDDQVELRPVLEDDLPALEELTQDPEKTGEFGWFGWLNRQRWRRAWDENRLLGDDGGTLMVVRGSDSLGLVNWRRHQTTPAGYCWEIGIALLPRARGRGYGTEAHRLLARYLFARTPPIASGPGPRQATSPNRRRWRRRDSPGKACCADAAGATAPGVTG
jgi:RimJ/RimL family protein N-acetyltransferase